MRLENHDVLLDVLHLLLAKELPTVALAGKFLSESVRFGKFVGVLAKPTKLYAIGGQRDVADPDSSLNSVEVFDESHGAWNPIEPMSKSRANPSAASASGKLYVIGGGGRNGEPEEGEVYNPVRKEWKQLTPLPRTFVQVMLAEARGSIYMMGLDNENVSGKPHCCIQIMRYVEEEARWERLCERYVPGGWIGSSRVIGLGDRIYIVAWGSGSGGTKGRGMVEAYDLTEKRWITLAPTTVRRSQHALTVCNGRIFCIGGVGPASETCERYDHETDRWERIDATLERFNVAAAECDGKLITVGGFGPRSIKGVTVETINVSSTGESKWSRGGLPPLNEARIGPALVGMAT